VEERAAGAPEGSPIRVVWAKDRFVALGRGGLLLSSPDGAEWRRENTGTREDLADAIAYRGRIVITTRDGSILTSGDGTTWSAVKLPGLTG